MAQHTGWLTPERVTGTELIDLPGVTERDLAGNLADLARINRWFGGAWLTLRTLRRLTRATPPNTTLTLLDVATGAADIPRAIADWAARRQQPVHILATDISPPIVQIARVLTMDHGQWTMEKNPRTKNQEPRTESREPKNRRTITHHASRITHYASRSFVPSFLRSSVPLPQRITWAAADGCRLPLSNNSVDVALCSFALHHLDPPQAVAMLREMGRVARRGVIVNDLVRWWPAYAATLLISRAVSRNPLTRHDGPLSVLRAYTGAEMRALAEQAGLRVLACDTVLSYRVALTLAKDG